MIKLTCQPIRLRLRLPWSVGRCDECNAPHIWWRKPWVRRGKRPGALPSFYSQELAALDTRFVEMLTDPLQSKTGDLLHYMGGASWVEDEVWNYHHTQQFAQFWMPQAQDS